MAVFEDITYICSDGGKWRSGEILCREDLDGCEDAVICVRDDAYPVALNAVKLYEFAPRMLPKYTAQTMLCNANVLPLFPITHTHLAQQLLDILNPLHSLLLITHHTQRTRTVIR